MGIRKESESARERIYAVRLAGLEGLAASGIALD
jgi:hypothetical protein